MRDRAVDLALIIGLVLVAGAIVWTLFSLGGDRSGPGPDRGAPIGQENPSGGGVVPIAPDGSVVGPSGGSGGADGGADGGAGAGVDGASSGGIAPVAPDDTDASAGDAADGSGASSGDAAGGASDTRGSPDVNGSSGDAATVTGPLPDRPDPEIPAADAAPVPASGPTGVGRVGFSFVTGGAGACGIVLEPWTHVAVSRELLAAYGCGAEVTLVLDEPKDGRTTVQAVVADTMNEAFSRTVNVYVGEDEPALQYGLTSGTIAPR